VRVPARFIELGREALDRILPRESASRPYDMAQLSLIWPYRVLDEEMRAHVLRNIENNLVREHGVVRYPGDTYYNPDPMSPYGNEAEWPMGLSWLAIVYGKMAEEKFNEGGERTAIEYLKKSHHYVKRTEKTMTGEYVIPELYADGRPNPNTPLGWAQAMYIIAVQVIENLKARMERK
jgi:phosphorylase kinase alpha/beta subunit